jgi:hypothetical protein
MKPIPKLQIYKEGIKLKQNATIFSNRVLNTCRGVQHLKERMHGIISKSVSIQGNTQVQI